MSEQTIQAAAVPAAARGFHLSDDEALAFVASAMNPAILIVSTNGCFPCRQLDPVARKLAVEFEAPLAFLDGDAAANFNRAFAIDSFPQMLLLRDGKLAERYSGFVSYADTRRVAAEFFARDLGDLSSPAEIAFETAWLEACTRTDEIMSAPSEALSAHIEAVGPTLEAFQAAVRADVDAGRIDKAEGARRMRAERDHCYAPFKDKIEELPTGSNPSCGRLWNSDERGGRALRARTLVREIWAARNPAAGGLATQGRRRGL